MIEINRRARSSAPTCVGCVGEAETPDDAYLCVEWKHTQADDPVMLCSELDADRWEVRGSDVTCVGVSHNARILANTCRVIEIMMRGLQVPRGS